MTHHAQLKFWRSHHFLPYLVYFVYDNMGHIEMTFLLIFSKRELWNYKLMANFILLANNFFIWTFIQKTFKIKLELLYVKVIILKCSSFFLTTKTWLLDLNF